MRNKALIAVMSSAFVMIVAGCSTAVMDVDGSSTGGATVNYKNSPVDIKILDTRCRTVNGFLKVNAELENGISNPYHLEYKFAWFDSGGMEVEPDSSAWTPIYLNGKETKTIQGLAPTPAAKSYKIKIREASYDEAVFKWQFKPLFN